MTQQQTSILRPEALVEEYEKYGVTHIITIPRQRDELLVQADAEAAAAGHHPRLARRSWSTALGLNVAGKTPVVLILSRTGWLSDDFGGKRCRIGLR